MKTVNTGPVRSTSDLRCIGLIAALLVLAGCTTVSALLPAPGNQRSVTSNERYSDIEVIAADLVNALMQVDNKHPQNTVIKMDRPQSTFGTALKAVFENAGYGLRIGRGDLDGLELDYSVEPKNSEDDGRHYTYFISVGDVKMKRDYFVQARGVTPSSNLFVIGADPASIRLNDSIFDAPEFVQPDETIAATTSIDVASTAPVTISPVAKKESAVRIQNDTPVIREIVPAQDTPAVVATKPGSDTSISSKPGKRANMYELGESNYAGFLADYSEIHKEVLIFPNDSMRLGEKNKLLINSIANRLAPDSDIVSVIGCSHGRSKLENGNAVLATGRAQRVKEALMIAGVAEERVLEEGCWSAEYFDEVMPRRGVVISIKREPRNG